jgi:cytochrome c553
MMTRLSFLLLLGWLALTLASAPAAADDRKADDRAGVEFFEKKIRPVLVQHCYACHSQEAQKKKKLRGGLLLDSKEGWQKGGDSGPVLVPGKAKDSLLLKSLRHETDLRMPPSRKLPDAVVADFAAWINRGAPDPRSGAVVKARGMSVEEGRKFWAYRQPVRPAVPAVKDTAWPRGEIDAFLLARMEPAGLRPAADADRATLIRRVHYDLTGLPPTPEQVEAFVHDNRPDAYERLVDRLLASPHFGERWGRHWLDVARYAESMTLRGFVFKEAWRYRDHVIDRFNEDAPFDDFIREQIAGDLLPAGNLEQKRRQLTATTFLALANTNLEEQDKKQLVMDVVDEQLDTIGRAFLAQTLGCARCHDHKFDPVPTKDYYALAGILRNTKTLKHANVSQWLEVPLPGDPAAEQATKAHEQAVAALQKQVQTLRTALGKKAKPLNPKRPLVRAVADLPGIVIDDAKAKKVGEWKDSKYSGTYVGAGYIHDGNTGKGEKTVTFQTEVPRTGRYEVRLAYSAGTNRAAKVPVTVFSADGEKTIHIDQRQTPDIDGLFVSLGQYCFERTGQSFVIVANEGTMGHVIADAVVFIPVEDLAAVKEVKGAAGKAVGDDAAKLRRLEQQLKKLTANGPRRQMVMSVQEEARIEDTHVHVRGSVHNLGEKAPRGFLRVASYGEMPAMPANESGRRQLADWITGKENPLTARVFVNRAWHWLFGAGLVRTTDNFGTTGEKPSHPELLDHLAVRFVEDGWSVKKLVRAIVLSRAYQQSAVADRLARAGDPENRLLAHANRRRLEAECIRDTILTVSGRLTIDRGGPTFPVNLATDYAYKHSDTRRSVYAPVFRNSLPELFEVFDFADPSVSTGRRNVSTVVPQALFLMNHPFVPEQSRHAARRLLAEPARDDNERITRAYRLALGRPPADAERRLIAAFLAGASDHEDAWAQAFQVLFASVDFRYVN